MYIQCWNAGLMIWQNQLFSISSKMTLKERKNGMIFLKIHSLNSSVYSSGVSGSTQTAMIAPMSLYPRKTTRSVSLQIMTRRIALRIRDLVFLESRKNGLFTMRSSICRNICSSLVGAGCFLMSSSFDFAWRIRLMILIEKNIRQCINCREWFQVKTSNISDSHTLPYIYEMISYHIHHLSVVKTQNWKLYLDQIKFHLSLQYLLMLIDSLLKILKCLKMKLVFSKNMYSEKLYIFGLCKKISFPKI